jgi:ABC-type sulfate transport system substrate-binding protein
LRELIGGAQRGRHPRAAQRLRPKSLTVSQRNPRNIRDWDDLTRPGVQVMTANAKTSGGARLGLSRRVWRRGQSA